MGLCSGRGIAFFQVQYGETPWPSCNGLSVSFQTFDQERICRMEEKKVRLTNWLFCNGMAGDGVGGTHVYFYCSLGLKLDVWSDPERLET